jgi:hypothetical protein
VCAQCLQGQGAADRQGLNDISVPAGSVVRKKKGLNDISVPQVVSCV